MQGVCGALEKCREADDQVVVEKIVVKVFEKMPEDFVKQEHHKTLAANGLCRVYVRTYAASGSSQRRSCSSWESPWVIP